MVKTVYQEKDFKKRASSAILLPMDIFSAAVSLFLVFNVLGNIPFYIAVLKPYTPKRQKFILVRELLYATIILILFSFFGDALLEGIGISEGTLGVSGGIILLLIAITMIFPKHSEEGLPDHEPYIVPIAIPCMAGPGSITAVMLYSHTFDNLWATPLIILCAVVPSLLLLLVASNIKYLVGEKGLIAFERLGGLLICFIAIQMIASGSIKLVKDNFPSTTQQVEKVN
ncbi:MarC family protein [bacterium]|nr:MarC family protein [bacterium]